MKLRYLPILALAVASCSPADKTATITGPDARFDTFKNQFI